MPLNCKELFSGAAGRRSHTDNHILLSWTGGDPTYTTYRGLTCHSSCTNTFTDSVSLSIFTYLMSKHIGEHSNQRSVDLG